MSRSMTDLHCIAEDMGLRIVRFDKGPPAFYRHSERTIYTRRGQSVASYRSSLAHELGHAHYQDEHTRDPKRTSFQEHRADLYACHLLIDPDEWEQAAIWHDHHLGAIADELEITHHLAHTWAHHLRRKLCSNRPH